MQRKNRYIAKAVGLILLSVCLIRPSSAFAAQTTEYSEPSTTDNAISSSITVKNGSLHNTKKTTASHSKKKTPPSSSTSSVKVSKCKKKILQNEIGVLELSHVPSNATVTFSSSNSSILTVTQTNSTSCNYIGESSGSAKIEIKIATPRFLFFDNTEEITVPITVTPRAVSIVFRKSTRNITIGQTVNLSYTLRPSISQEKPVFSSLRKRIATVNKKGTVKGRKSGTTYIYATLSNGKSAKCRVVVKKGKTGVLP